MEELAQFSNVEKERINQLYGNDFEGITPNDAILIARWERAKAIEESEHAARMQAIKAESQANLEQSRAFFDKAMENLNAQHEAAMKRLEAFDNGI